MAARRLVLALLFLCAVVAGAAAGTSPRPEPTPPPEVGATRAAQPIEVDGRLEERPGRPSRRGPARAARSRRGRDGDRGQRAEPPLRRRSAVRRRATLRPRHVAVNRRVSRRDEPADADRFAIYLDPGRDRRTGVRFEVSAAGVQRDQAHLQRHLDGQSWDAVWDSAVDPRRAGLDSRDADLVRSSASSVPSGAAGSGTARRRWRCGRASALALVRGRPVGTDPGRGSGPFSFADDRDFNYKCAPAQQRSAVGVAAGLGALRSRPSTAGPCASPGDRLSAPAQRRLQLIEIPSPLPVSTVVS